MTDLTSLGSIAAKARKLAAGEPDALTPTGWEVIAATCEREALALRKARLYGPQEHYLVCNAKHEDPIGEDGCICWRLWNQEVTARLAQPKADLAALYRRLGVTSQEDATKAVAGLQARVRYTETETALPTDTPKGRNESDG